MNIDGYLSHSLSLGKQQNHLKDQKLTAKGRHRSFFLECERNEIAIRAYHYPQTKHFEEFENSKNANKVKKNK